MLASLATLTGAGHWRQNTFMKIENITIDGGKMKATVANTDEWSAGAEFQNHLDNEYDDEWMVLSHTPTSIPGEFIIICENIS